MSTNERQAPAGRTRWITPRLVTGVSIAAVAAAGALALGANIGILDAADNSTVGTLAAAGDLTPPSTQVVDVYVNDGAATTQPATTVASVPAAAGGQQYAVDTAGTVTVSALDGMVHLDQAVAVSGWTWSSTQPGPTDLTVTFTNGVRTLDFVAVLNPDGTVGARVDEPQVVSTPVVIGGGGSDEGDEHEGGGDDD